MEKSDIKKLFSNLSNNLDIFIEEVKKKKSSATATDEWTVKDVLCHLVFWHESYAANYKALAANLEPPLLDGPGYMLNEQAVTSLHKFPTKKLLRRLQKANNTLYESIVEKKVPQMTYKKAGHVYTTPEFLYLIARHFTTHTKQVKKAK